MSEEPEKSLAGLCRGVAELRWNGEQKIEMVAKLLAQVAARVEVLEKEVTELLNQLTEGGPSDGR